MSDVELLFLVLALIYAWECSCWLRWGSTGFVNWFGERWRPVKPISMLGNSKGGFVFAPVLPPLGGILTSHAFPVLISPDGVLPNSAASLQTPSFVPFQDIRTIAVKGKKVIVNGQVLSKTPSSTLALQTAATIRDLLKAAPQSRDGSIQKIWRERFDTRAIGQRWKEFEERTAKLRIMANVLFMYIFLCAPLAILSLGFGLSWPALLAGLFALTFSITFLFRRIHRHYYPAADDERFTHVLINMFSPATTIRARDVLSRPLLETFDPLAIAKVFCSEEQFKRLAAATLRDLHYPLPSVSAPDPVIGKIDAYARKHQQRAIEDFLKKSGLDLEALLRPPVLVDATCRSYCPRCQAQFTVIRGTCADCADLELVPFGKN